MDASVDPKGFQAASPEGIWKLGLNGAVVKSAASATSRGFAWERPALPSRLQKLFNIEKKGHGPNPDPVPS